MLTFLLVIRIVLYLEGGKLEQLRKFIVSSHNTNYRLF
jgi:hypothetical protein